VRRRTHIDVRAVMHRIPRVQADRLLWPAQTVTTRDAPGRRGRVEEAASVQCSLARVPAALPRAPPASAARARAQVDAPAARFRSLARVAAAPAPGSASFTHEALQAWREACSGPHFLAAAAALTPLTQTLPQLLHHQARWAPPVWRPGALGSARWPVPPLQSDVACGASARHAGAGPVLRTAVSRARPQPRRRAPDGRRRAGARRRAWRTSSCARSAGRRRCRWRARWRCWRRLRATCRPTSCRTCRARCPRWPTCWTKARAAIGCRAG